MPRPVRVHVEGALCYVTSRANEGGALFRDARDYEAYRKLLLSYQARYGFKLFAYVLLPDQLHLALELTNGVTISTIMHAINSRYTKHVAKRYGRTGHLFQERFHLTLIEKAPSLLRLTGFLHQLPQRKGAAADLREYPWSSYLGYLAAAGSSIGPTPGGEVQEVLDLLAAERPGMTYEAYVHGLSSDALDELELALETPVVGSEAFRTLVAERQQAAAVRGLTVAAPGGQAAHEPSLPAPRPQPRVGRLPSFMVTTSLAVAFLSLCTTVFYANGFTLLQENVRVLAQERASAFLAAFGRSAAPAVSSSRLAALSAPATLAGTVWELHLRPMNGAAAQAQIDRLRFDGWTMTSDELKANGFQPSKYTAIPQDGGSVVWEAVQADRQGTLVTWRGTWNGRTMHGVLTRQAPGQPAMNCGFVGSVASQGAGQATSEI
jgi:REP element-mobilizing transposase RayT